MRGPYGVSRGRRAALRTQPPTARDGTSAADAGEPAYLARLVRAVWYGKAAPGSPPPSLAGPGTPVYAVLRCRGRRLARAWATGSSVVESIARAILQGRAALAHAQLGAVDTVEIAIAGEAHRVAPAERARVLDAGLRRGVQGFEFALGAHLARYAPTYAIATNRSARRLMELFLAEAIADSVPGAGDVEVRVFNARQFLVRLPGEGPALALERGSRYVPLAAVTREGVSRFVSLASAWLRANVHADGRLTYAYWPSAARESDANNMIRQWMATVALGEAADHARDAGLRELRDRNLDYNLRAFFCREGLLGLIEYRGKVKLGALAMAAIALRRQAADGAEELALYRTIERLWQADGAFRTFYRPAERNDNQNFYPGEALLYLVERYLAREDPALLGRLMQSFRHYRRWHLDPQRRNPAFVPWHTQAWYLLWTRTGDRELAEFVFEMNDWLLALQQWPRGRRHRDTRGRFHDPARPHLGPPHASSTAVYLEGLSEAFALARASGDETRQRSYRRAILRGMRSLMQLQFVDSVDMYYVPAVRRPRVRGGLRTTVYDNRIRCDNVQHALMAALKVLRSFDPGDFPAAR